MIALHATSHVESKLPDSLHAPMQAISARNQKRYSGVSIDGTGPSSKLTANKRTLVAACIMLAIGLVAALVGGAIFFLWASWGIRHDIACVPRDCCPRLNHAPPAPQSVQSNLAVACSGSAANLLLASCVMQAHICMCLTRSCCRLLTLHLSDCTAANMSAQHHKGMSLVLHVLADDGSLLCL